MKQTFAIGIGGAAGQGVATPGDIFAKIFSRRGLNLNAYNAYQSIIRGGHTFLTIRTGPDKITNMGDRIDLFIPLNQDSMDRHLKLLTAGAACIYNADTIRSCASSSRKKAMPLWLKTSGLRAPAMTMPLRISRLSRIRFPRRRTSTRS